MATAKRVLEHRRKAEQFLYYVPLDYPKGQRDFHLSHKKIRAAFGGNKSGKTEAGCVEMIIQSTGVVPKALEKDYSRKIVLPSDNWIVNLDFPAMRDIVLPKFFRLLPKGYLRRYYKTDQIVELKGGSIVGLKSCDSGERKFQGTSKHNIWFDEEPQKEVYEECLMRTLDTAGNLWFTETPTNGITWTYDDLFMNDLLDLDIECFQFLSRMNTHLPEGELDKILSKIPEEERGMRERGDFISRSGFVFTGFTPSIHIIDPIPLPSTGTRYRVIDPGIGDQCACLWLWVGYDGQKIYYRDYYQKDRSVGENAKAILKLKSKGERPEVTMIDPSAKNRNPVSGTSIQKEFLRCGIPTRLANNEIEPGIDKCRQGLMIDNKTKRPRTLIFRNCINFIKEIRKASWETIRKKDNHLLSAWRYLEMYDPKWIDPTPYPIKEEGVNNDTTGY